MHSFADAERSLTQILAKLLDHPKVSAQDNFFSLGGDSIVAIQLVARARQHGYAIKPRQVFSTSTIAELAAHAQPLAATANAPTVQVTGEVGLSPIQARFFQKVDADLHHYNQALLVEVPASFDGARFAACIPALLKLHDALRASFTRDADGRWRQNFHELSPEMSAQAYGETLVEGDIEDDAFQSLLEGVISRVQSGFDLGRPPLIRFHQVHRARTGERLLLMAAHHLVVDAVSWTILLDDLDYLYANQRDGLLPQKSGSYREWVDALRKVDVNGNDRALWRQTLEDIEPLPFAAAAPGKVRDISDVTLLIGTETTSRLNECAQRSGQLTVIDVVTTALATAIQAMSCSDRVSLMVEDNSRTVSYIDHDSSRTVGWYTSLYPVTLHLGAGASPRENLSLVKEQLSRIPESGLTYGLARYLSADAKEWQALPEPQVCLNYFGRLFSARNGTGLFAPSKYAELASRAARSPQQTRAFAIDVVASQSPDGLFFQFVFDERTTGRASVEALARSLSLGLEDLVEALEHQTDRNEDARFESEAAEASLHAALRPLKDEKREVEAVCAATKIQSGILFHCLKSSATGVYVPQHAIEIRAPLDASAFRQAWQGVLDRNAILRTGFRRREGGEIAQVVLRNVPVAFDEQDWRGSDGEIESRFQSLLKQEWLRPFDFSEPPLMRMCLVRLEEERYRFVWTYHHSILDGWSGPLVLREFFNLYEQLVGGTKRVPAPRRPFTDYVAWLEGQDPAKALAFWKEELDGYQQGRLISKTLQTARRTPVSPGRHDHSLALSEGATAMLVRAARQHGTTLSILCQAAWALLLSRYTGERDVLFGLTVSGRPAELEGVETMVGQFINTLPLRVKLDMQQSLTGFLQKLQTRYVDCNEYSHFPLAEIQEFLSFDRSAGPFDTLLVFENYPTDVVDGSIEGAQVCRHLHSVSQNNYPLSLVIVPGDRLRFTLKYSPAHFDGETIEAIMDVYQHIVSELCRLGETADRNTLAEVRLSSTAERDRLIRMASGPVARYPITDFASHFRSLAIRSPEWRALMTADPPQALTYAELHRASNRLANFLLQELRTGSNVGICLGRGVDQIVAMLACLKAGMPYVPLDPAYPQSRLNRTIEDARLAGILTNAEHVAKVSDCSIETLLLDLYAERDAIDSCASDDPGVQLHPEQPAYIIYTSGSTGGPKGVSVPHRALMSYISGVDERLMLSEHAVLAHLSSVAADLGYTAVYGALGTGRCLRLLAEEKSLDAPALAAELERSPVDCLKIVPSHLTALMSAANANHILPRECLVLGGEPPSKELLEAIRTRAPDLRVINHYGPTETTVGVCTQAQVAPEAPRTIGRPLANTQCHVLNDSLEPAGIAAEGDLYLAGTSVSNGYLGSARTTAQAFLPNPYSTSAGERMYRSGDRARYDHQGNLVFIGRKDSQIKIRGYRVELAEVEACLRAHEEVVDAVVDCRESSGRNLLVAYLVGDNTAEGSLKDYLKAGLPEHMHPHFIVWLDKLPLTSNGKVDRRALPAPGSATAHPAAAPTSPLERRIAAIWAGALGRNERPATDVNFFELGGDSLSLMKVHARIADEISDAVHVTDLFMHATISKLASYIQQLLDEATEQARLDDRAGQARRALQAGQDRARQRRAERVGESA